MSSMMEQAQTEPSNQGAVAQFAPSAPVKRIKRVGGRPLVFEGSELAMAMSYTPTLPYWYETNLYRTTDNRFVACVRLFYVSADEQDTARAWECATLDEAIEKLVNYDAAADVRLTMDYASHDFYAAEMAAHALDIRARAKGYREHYASLIGEFLHDLDAPS
ncbi:MAG: hypothetical protein AAFY84_18115 [Pseudomonadota bacterium]